MRVVYLHGFASSPQSSKARFFATRLAARGIDVDVPDLNEPDFSTLTVTRMLGQAAAALERGTEPAVVVGSSLGGFVAVQTAVKYAPRVERLVLLAPALQFDPSKNPASTAVPGGNRLGALGSLGLEAWKTSDALEVFHYGYGRPATVHYGLFADAQRYDSLNARPTQRIQVFQGRRDDSVDPATVERWAADRSNVELHLLDDDHQLHASLEYIWRTAFGQD